MPPQRRVTRMRRKAAAQNSTPPRPPPAPETPTPAAETLAATPTPTPTPPPPAATPAAKASTRPPPDDSPKPATTRKVRKVIKKVIIKKIVPKGTLAARKAAAAAAAEAAAEVSKPAEETLAEKAAVDCNYHAAVEKAVRKEQEAEETLAEKPTVGCDAAVVEESLGKVVKVATGCDAASVKEEVVGEQWEAEETIDEKSVADRYASDWEGVEGKDAEWEGEAGILERRKRRRREVFVGGLDRGTEEEDVREVFSRAGEITKVRMVVDARTGKNKGYCFVQYREATQAKKAIAELAKVEICGKLCGAAALDGNDTIFLGNIDKKWRKEDMIKLLQNIGVENIDTVTLMADPNNPGCNRGFAFLELETNRDAQMAYKKLSKKDVFGKRLNIRVAWAEPLNDPDEEEMQKVKSIFVEGVPTSWDQAKLTEIFKKYGKIERVVLSRDIQSAKRKDFAFVNYTTREDAISCLESFEKEVLTENGSKVNIKVSLAKPVQKGKQNKGRRKLYSSEKYKPKIAQSETKVRPSSVKIMRPRVVHTKRDNKSSTTHELLHVLREQATWRPGQASLDPAIRDYPHIYSGEKRAFSAVGDDSSYPMRGHPHPCYDSNAYRMASSSSVLPHEMGRTSQPHYYGSSTYPEDSYYGISGLSASSQMRQAAPREQGLPYGSRQYQKY